MDVIEGVENIPAKTVAAIAAVMALLGLGEAEPGRRITVRRVEPWPKASPWRWERRR